MTKGEIYVLQDMTKRELVVYLEELDTENRRQWERLHLFLYRWHTRNHDTSFQFCYDEICRAFREDFTS